MHEQSEHPEAAPAGPDAASPSRRTVSRRTFLAGSAIASATAAVTVGTSYAFATPGSPADGDVIVLVFLRGGNDGLSLVAPYQMPTYRALRPNIAVKGPDEFADPTGKAGLPLVQGGNVADFALSGTFAMHPGMASLHAGPWADGHLALVHAVGMPASESDTRSHFDSQRNWETGTASWNYTTGFLNRYLMGQSNLVGLPAVGRGSSLQQSLSGSVGAYSIDANASFSVSGFSSGSNNNRARAALGSWYDAGTGDLLLQTGANTISAIATVNGVDWSSPAYQPQNGATYAQDDLAGNLREVAQLIRAGIGLRCVAIDVGGWDTHSDMGMPEDPGSYYRGQAAMLSDALTAFATDLGPAMDEVTLFTVSEFGRTINENGSGGTDHGRGSVMLALGNKIRGGVYGSFVPSITDGPEGDLAVLNDYRRPISEILAVRGGATNLSTVFPTYAQEAPLGLCVP